MTESFLRVPTIYPDEFLPSYLLRTAYANSYDSYGIFKSVINERTCLFGEKDNLDNPTRPETYKAIEQLCGLPEGRSIHHTVHKFADIFVPFEKRPEFITLSTGEDVYLSSHETCRRSCRSIKQTAFCPSCLVEAAYYKLEWHLLSTTVCLKHNNLLIDYCDKCGSNLSVSDIVNCHCPKCNFDLRSSETCSISEDGLSIGVQLVLNSWMGMGEPRSLIEGVSINTQYKLFTGLKHCIQKKGDWKHLHAFPDFDISKLKNQDLEKWILPNKYLHKLNISAITPLFAFPFCMEGFWRDYADESKNKNVSLGLGNLYWGWLEKRWLSEEFEFLQEAFNEFLVNEAEILYPGIAKSRRMLENPQLKEKFKYITVSLASREIKSLPTKIQRLVDCGKIESKELQTKRNKIVVSQKDVLAYSKRLSETVNMTTTCEMLGISKTLVNSLLKHNHLEAIGGRTSDGSPEWAITRESIEDFKRRLQKVSKVIPVNDKTVRIKGKTIVQISRQLAGWGFEIGEILQKVFDGKYPASIVEGEEICVNTVMLPIDTSTKLKEELLDKNQWVSEKELAHDLGVKTITIHRWAKSGLIIPVGKICLITFYSKSSIIDFSKNYIDSKQASKFLRVGILTVQKWARTGRLKPVSGSEIDGCHEYLFKLSEVEKLKVENRLSAPQMAKILGISRSQMCTRIHQGKVKPISGPGIDDSKHYLFEKQELM